MPRQPHELFDTRQEKADLEARNGLLQSRAIEQIVNSSKGGFEFTEDTLCELHRLTIQDIYTCAGKIRTTPVYLVTEVNGVAADNDHQPAPHEDVPALVDEMCAYINGNFGKSAIHLAAYAMWRINWIHPFSGGNGRTSRGASYLLLNVRMGFNLPGINTIMQQIEADRQPYYDALKHADRAQKNGIVDVSAMEAMISQMLASQLLSVHQKATGLSN